MNTLYPAHWLSLAGERDTEQIERYGKPCPCFRREFSLLDKPLKSAELWATAIGVFKAYVNGEPADGDYMSPGFTDYRVRIPWLKYDITGLVKKDNAVVLVAGDGWAAGYMGNRMLRRNYYRDVSVCAKIVLKYMDGEKQEIITDDAWRVDTDEIMRTDNYMGEVVDHRAAKNKRFYLPGYDYSEGGWQKPVYRDYWINYARLSEEVEPRIKVMHTLVPEKISHSGRKTIYDMKQNMVGVVRLRVKGTAGTVLRLRYGEMLEKDGTLYVENLRRAESTDIFILKGGEEEEFRPLFTFHGFRYVEVRVTGSAEIIAMTGEVMYTALEKTAEFECSDSLVNRIYSNIVWGQRGNFLSVPTDCPQRDERLGWTGDAQIFCGSAMFNMDCDKFYRKYIQDLIDSQYGDGAIGGIAPCVPHTESDDTEYHAPCAAGWSDAMAVIPYEHYLMYGDRKFLKETLYFTKKYIRLTEKWSDDCIRPAEPNWGDWLNVDCNTDKSLLSTAYFAFSTRLTAKMCRITGDEDAAEFEVLYKRIAAAFRKKFVKEDNTLTCHTQTAYLLTCAAGIMTLDEIKPAFMDTLHAAGDKLTTGFLGIKFLLPTICNLGETQLAYKILCSREYPGWGYSALNGATTIWERWNSYTADKGFGDVGMNSFNHYSLGSVSEWMFKYCLGIMPEEEGAGFKKITLRPFLDPSGKITWAKGYYDSKMGRISVKWKTTDGKKEYFASVPKGIELTVDAPKDVKVTLERF